jgi:hypothetical protein
MKKSQKTWTNPENSMGYGDHIITAILEHPREQKALPLDEVLEAITSVIGFLALRVVGVMPDEFEEFSEAVKQDILECLEFHTRAGATRPDHETLN